MLGCSQLFLLDGFHAQRQKKCWSKALTFNIFWPFPRNISVEGPGCCHQWDGNSKGWRPFSVLATNCMDCMVISNRSN